MDYYLFQCVNTGWAIGFHLNTLNQCSVFGLILSINTTKVFQDEENSFLAKCIFHSVCHLSIIWLQSDISIEKASNRSHSIKQQITVNENLLLSIQIQSTAAPCLFIILYKVMKPHLKFCSLFSDLLILSSFKM